MNNKEKIIHSSTEIVKEAEKDNPKAERTDFIIFNPKKDGFKKRHRIEVKNVKLRERGARGLAFDGDSMIGFFNQSSEFTASNVEVIEKHCKNTGGFCYS